MKLVQSILATLIRKFFGVTQISSVADQIGSRVYYANHTSHLDFLLLWAVVPDLVRPRLRPVAAKGYWSKSIVRRFLANHVFRAILIDRNNVTRSSDPLSPMLNALDQGDSLMIFPEGTRCCEDEPGEFKSGIFHLHRKRPDVPFIPVWLGNCSRVFPKGALVPIPVIAKVAIGDSINTHLKPISKQDFLSLAKTKLLSLQTL